MKTSSSSMIARGGSRLANSSSSSLIATISILGLPTAEGEEDGVSIAGAVESASLSDSTLTLKLVSTPPSAILEGVMGEGGEDGIDSSGRIVRKLIVTLLEVGGSDGR